MVCGTLLGMVCSALLGMVCSALLGMVCSALLGLVHQSSKVLKGVGGVGVITLVWVDGEARLAVGGFDVLGTRAFPKCQRCVRGCRLQHAAQDPIHAGCGHPVSNSAEGTRGSSYCREGRDNVGNK